MDKKCSSRVLKPLPGARPAAGGPARAKAGPADTPTSWVLRAFAGQAGPAGSRAAHGARETDQQAAAAGLEAERAALAAERARLEHARGLLQSCADSLGASRKDVLQQAEAELAELSIQIAALVIHEEIGRRPELIVKQVEAALARIRESGTITIRIHPSALKVIQEHSWRVTETLDPATRLHFEPDASIVPGGCLVETVQRIVDARIETQLGRIGKAFADAPPEMP